MIQRIGFELRVLILKKLSMSNLTKIIALEAIREGGVNCDNGIVDWVRKKTNGKMNVDENTVIETLKKLLVAELIKRSRVTTERSLNGLFELTEKGRAVAEQNRLTFFLLFSFDDQRGVDGKR